jgi:hypothetical protein
VLGSCVPKRNLHVLLSSGVIVMWCTSLVLVVVTYNMLLGCWHWYMFAQRLLAGHAFESCLNRPCVHGWWSDLQLLVVISTLGGSWHGAPLDLCYCCCCCYH